MDISAASVMIMTSMLQLIALIAEVAAAIKASRFGPVEALRLD